MWDHGWPTNLPRSVFLVPCSIFYQRIIMENKKPNRPFLPLVIVFIITNALFVSARALFERYNISVDVLIVGNLVLFISTWVSFYFYNRSLRSNNAAAILRMVYASIGSRMFICIIAIVIYIVIARSQVNKGGIVGCMFLYIVYTAVEMAVLRKLSKQNKHA
jgi:hypothetical protein